MKSKQASRYRPPQQLPGLARNSYSWIDAVGPGYAVGPTDAMLRHVAAAALNGYHR